ncbi:MAG: helix-turn-helix domain-containing protein [Clostridium sp.]|nr:helix-turn-helix domain-containing protein [Clostridium sp.]
MKYYETKELAEMLHVHPETIKREVQRNKLQCFKVGSELRFTQDHVDEYTNAINFGKTTREIELEKEIEMLNEQIHEQYDFINIVKTELIKLN